MKLDPVRQKFIADRLYAVWKSPRICPTCKVEPSKWYIGATQEIRQYHEGNFITGGSITPLVGVMCDDCGYVLWFNAVMLGVVNSVTGRFVASSPPAEVKVSRISRWFASFFG